MKIKENVMTPTYEDDFKFGKYEFSINIITLGCRKDIGNYYN